MTSTPNHHDDDPNDDEQDAIALEVGVAVAERAQQLHPAHLEILQEPAVMQKPHRIHFGIADADRDGVLDGHESRREKAADVNDAIFYRSLSKVHRRRIHPGDVATFRGMGAPPMCSGEFEYERNV